MYDTDFFTICYKKLICLYTLFKYIMEFDFQNNDNIQDIIEDYDFETEDKNEVRYINPSQLKEFIYNDEEFFEKLGIRN